MNNLRIDCQGLQWGRMSHRKHPNLPETPSTLPQKGVTIHDENGHYFTVDNSFRQKIDTTVRELSG